MSGYVSGYAAFVVALAATYKLQYMLCFAVTLSCFYIGKFYCSVSVGTFYRFSSVEFLSILVIGFYSHFILLLDIVSI